MSEGSRRKPSRKTRCRDERILEGYVTAHWTIDGVKSSLAAKKISTRELTTDFYKSINPRNPELNAYLALSPERAYAQADKIDALIAAGKPLPPLAGVPIAINDVHSTNGTTTTCVYKIPEHQLPADADTAVETLANDVTNVLVR